MQRIKLHLYVFLQGGYHNTLLHGRHTVRYIHLRAVDGVMQHLCFPFAACHFLSAGISNTFADEVLLVFSREYESLKQGENSEAGLGLMCVLFPPKLSVSLGRRSSRLFQLGVPSGSRSFLFQIYPPFLPPSLFTPSQNRELEEKRLSPCRVSRREMIGMEDKARLSSRGWIEA